MTNPIKMKHIVRGDYVITNPALGKAGISRNGAVAIDEDGRIADVDDGDKIVSTYPGVPQEGGRDCLVMPGFIDAHCHGKGVTHFELGLGYTHLEYWNTRLSSLPKPDPTLDALWCGIKHLKSGCTTLHHMNTALSLESAEAAIKGYNTLGIRWAFSLTIKDQNLVTYDDRAFLSTLPGDLGPEFKARWMDDPSNVDDAYFGLFEIIRSTYQTPGNPILHGPMGPQWCSKNLLSRIKESSDRFNLRIHMHALQTPYQKEAFFRTENHSALSTLSDLGILSPSLTLGHCVWLDQAEILRLAEAGCSVTHHASCNLNMRNGIMPLPELLSKGIVVAIGMDDKGINDDNDMMQELRVVEKLHRISGFAISEPLPVPSDQIITMGTINGARVLGMNQHCGTIEVGKTADLIILDLPPRPWMHPDTSPFDRVVMQGKASDIRAVFVGGEMVMKEGVILTVNEEEVRKELGRSMGFDLSPKDHATSELWSKLQPHVVTFYNHWQPFSGAITPYYVVNRKK
jgi:5-methylthioadenosine/S-adenosylhomocysteine deaminase